MNVLEKRDELVNQKSTDNDMAKIEKDKQKTKVHLTQHKKTKEVATRSSLNLKLCLFNYSSSN